MAVFEFGEVLNFIFDVAVFIFLIAYFAYNPDSRRVFLFPMVFLMLSHGFTVMEGFAFPVLFNILEHLLFLASAVSLAIGLTNSLRGGK